MLAVDALTPPVICGDGVDNDCSSESNPCLPSGDVDLAGADAAWYGEEDYDSAGDDLAGAGDIDGDGQVDLVIGAPLAGGTGSPGRAYVVTGPFEGERSLAEVDLQLEGAADGDYAGSTVGAGDFDGDGMADLLIGAPEHHVGGGVHVVFGPITSAMSLADAPVTLLGNDSGDRAGVAAVSVGDTDGDGVDDLAIGANFAADAGAAYVVLGPFTGATTVSDGSAKMLGEDLGEGAGRQVCGGDLNGDGLADVGVSDNTADANGSSSGAVYLVDGPATLRGSLSNADARLLGGASENAGTGLACSGGSGSEMNDSVYLKYPYH